MNRKRGKKEKKSLSCPWPLENMSVEGWTKSKSDNVDICWRVSFDWVWVNSRIGGVAFSMPPKSEGCDWIALELRNRRNWFVRLLWLKIVLLLITQTLQLECWRKVEPLGKPFFSIRHWFGGYQILLLWRFQSSGRFSSENQG